MAKHRYTTNELQKEGGSDYLNDLKLLRAIVSDRMGDCTNIYAPLCVRLQKLYRTLDTEVNKGREGL